MKKETALGSWAFWKWPRCALCRARQRPGWRRCAICGTECVDQRLAPASSPAAAPERCLAGPPETREVQGRTFLFPEGVRQGALLRADVDADVAWLVPLDGPHRGALWQFTAGIVLGSGSGVDFNLQDPGVSRRHARIQLDRHGRYRLTDLGSRNGTYVNELLVSSVDLVDNDRIRLGRTTLCFKAKR